MRKTIEILLLVLTVLLFVTAFISCKKNEAQAQAAAAAKLSSGFSCTAQVTLDGRAYTVQISKTASGGCTMSFAKPAELAPLRINLGSGGLTMQYGDLKTSVDPSSVPQSSVFSAMLGAFEQAAGSGAHASIRGQNILVRGSSQTGAYTLTLDQSLTPKELDIPALKMKATFSGFKYV